MIQESRVLNSLDDNNDVSPTSKEKPNKIPRIISLDFLRGLAIFLVVISYQFSTMYDSTWMHDPVTLLQQPTIIIIFGAILVFFGTFGSFFLLISMIVNFYSANKKIQKGVSPERILLKQIFTGILMLIYAYLFETVFHFHGYFGMIFFQGAYPTILMKKRLFLFGTFHTIGWSMIILSIIHYFLILKPRSRGKNTYNLTLITYFILIITIYVSTPFLTKFIANNYDGFPGIIYGDTQFNWPPISASDFFRRMFYSFLVGQYQPMFPYLATAIIGVILGMTLAKENGVRRLPLFIFMGSVLLLPAEVIMLLKALKENNFLYDYFGVASKLYFLTLFVELAVIGFFLWLIEYRGKTQKFQRISRYWRRWGAISLTIYLLQIISAVPRYIFEKITNWPVATNIIFGGEALFWQVLVVTIFVLLFWEGIIRLWELVNFVGSFEWLNARILSISGNLPLSNKSNPKKLIYNAKPVVFNNRKKKFN